jgi:hypothetical protein
LFENFKDITENMGVQLPLDVESEKISEIKIKVATPSQKGKAVVVVGFEKGKGMENSKFSATLNDVEYEKVRTEFMPFQYGK